MQTPHHSSLLLLPLLAVLVVACSDSNGTAQGPPGEMGDSTPAVEVIQARYGSLPLEERLSGTVRAENQVAIYSEIAAPVMRVVAENGDYVEAGQPLVYLRDTQFREQVRQAEAALQISQAEARRTEVTLRELRARLERVQQLADKQFQSEQELESLQAQVDAAEATHQQALGRIAQAEATLDEEREALRRTVVRAPISGYVGQRNAEVGMRVDTGTHLYTIGNFDKVRVEVAITDAMIGGIEKGQTALITLRGPNNSGQVVRAEVSRISPFLEEGSYSAGVEIDVPNEEGLLRPGMFVTVDILYGESQQATLIPTSALYEDPNTGVLGVYVATSLNSETPLREPDAYDADNPPPLTEPTPMTFREVDVLARGRGLAGVSGVQPDDWVVTVGQNLLSNADQNRVNARVRPISWERVASLQDLQDQDLLRQFMEKQQRLAQENFNDASPEAESNADSPAPDSSPTSDANPAPQP